MRIFQFPFLSLLKINHIPCFTLHGDLLSGMVALTVAFLHGFLLLGNSMMIDNSLFFGYIDLVHNYKLVISIFRRSC